MASRFKSRLIHESERKKLMQSRHVPLSRRKRMQKIEKIFMVWFAWDGGQGRTLMIVAEEALVFIYQLGICGYRSMQGDSSWSMSVGMWLS
jgi:hypothetical protein